MPHLTLVPLLSNLRCPSRSACLCGYGVTNVGRAAQRTLRQPTRCSLSPHVVSGVVAAATVYSACMTGLVSPFSRGHLINRPLMLDLHDMLLTMQAHATGRLDQ